MPRERILGGDIPVIICVSDSIFVRHLPLLYLDSGAPESV